MYNPMFDPDLTIQGFLENFLKMLEMGTKPLETRGMEMNRLKLHTIRLGTASRDYIWGFSI